MSEPARAAHASPAAERRPSEPELALGTGMAFEGLLVLTRPARIDGRVAGEVLAGGPLWVGPSGVVEADLEAASLVVEGHVTGNLRASHTIALGPTAVVRGDLAAPRLRIAEGAQVDGRCACGVDAAAPVEQGLPGGPPTADPACAAS